MTAAKAFDELCKRDPNSGGSNETAKRAACAGVVKQFTTSECGTEELREVLKMMGTEKGTESAKFVATVKKWAAEVNVYF